MTEVEPLQTLLRMSNPDEPVVLYQGSGHLSFGGDSERTPGELRLTLAWSPSPRIGFAFNTKVRPTWSPGREVEIHIAPARSLHARATNITTIGLGPEGETEIRGICWGEDPSQKAILDQVLFSVANLPELQGQFLRTVEDGFDHSWMGTATVEGREWRLRLDRIRSPGQSSSVNAWLQGWGYGITHVGKLERRDGGSIAVEQARDILPAVSQYLSFLRGAPTGVILPRGINYAGNVTWEKWAVSTITPWRGRVSSLPEHIVEEDRTVRAPRLDPIFSCFSDRWNDPGWADLLHLGVGWYVTANDHSSAEMKIVLSQLVLELAAWTAFVPGRLSKDGFNKLPAHDILRLLLTTAQVPVEIPRVWLGELSEYGAKEHWEDGPRLVTEVRNALVHPTKKLRASMIPAEILVQAGRLAIWYTQLVLLFVLQYDDEYVSSLSWGQEATPWERPMPMGRLPRDDRYDRNFPPLLP